MRKVLWVLPLLTLMGAQCGQSGNCTVAKDATTGVATISCPDGTSVDVGPGSQGPAGQKGDKGDTGTSCEVTKNADAGVTTIVCADGTTATVEDGADGADGADGQKGDKGDTGETGPAGPAGPAGPTGPAGPQGDAGVPGAVGLVSLVRLDDEPQGTNCPNGGTRVQSGVDTSGNGVLEAGEVTQTKYVCTPSAGSGGGSTACTVLEGSYTVTNTLDWQNLVKSGCTELTGDLIIAAPGLVTLTPSAALTSLGGNLRGGGNALLANLPFPELTTVGGYIDLSGNPALTAFTLPKLQSVAGKAYPGCRAAFPYRNDGTGTCVLTGCASGYRDGGDGQCVANGSCSVGFQEQAGWCRGELVSVTGGSASGTDWGFAGGSVTVASFQLDRTEVTVAQYGACVTVGNCTAPNTGGSCNWQVSGKELHPVNCVDWNQATAFCAWAGKRLPTEVEWQWAASNGGSTVYPWNDTAPNVTRAKYSSGDGTAAVATRPAGASQAGLQDLSGNVWEWTSSDYDASTKVVRGGSWTNDNVVFLRASYRSWFDPTLRYGYYGFRCAQ